MSHNFALTRRSSLLSKPVSLLLGLALAAFLNLAAYAQFGAPAAGTQVHDTTPLKPPAGSRVAIVEFEDMECPDCARANPVLKKAAAEYHIPWVRHDFLIPGHVWSPIAAVNARWFDSQGKGMGDEYRDQVFANQASIYGPPALNQFTEKFAADHHVALPFAIDPQGKLAAAVKADKDLGLRVGIEHTPTIWIVTDHSKGAPFMEVIDRSRLYQMIDQAKDDTASATVPVKTSAKAQTKKPTN